MSQGPQHLFETPRERRRRARCGLPAFSSLVPGKGSSESSLESMSEDIDCWFSPSSFVKLATSEDGDEEGGDDARSGWHSCPPWVSPSHRPEHTRPISAPGAWSTARSRRFDRRRGHSLEPIRFPRDEIESAKSANTSCAAPASTLVLVATNDDVMGLDRSLVLGDEDDLITQSMSRITLSMPQVMMLDEARSSTHVAVVKHTDVSGAERTGWVPRGAVTPLRKWVEGTTSPMSSRASARRTARRARAEAKTSATPPKTPNRTPVGAAGPSNSNFLLGLTTPCSNLLLRSMQRRGIPVSLDASSGANMSMTPLKALGAQHSSRVGQSSSYDGRTAGYGDAVLNWPLQHLNLIEQDEEDEEDQEDQEDKENQGDQEDSSAMANWLMEKAEREEARDARAQAGSAHLHGDHGLGLGRVLPHPPETDEHVQTLSMQEYAAIMEILSTEASYKSELETVVSLFLKPLQFEQGGIADCLTLREKELLFVNIEILLVLSTNLLAELKVFEDTATMNADRTWTTPLQLQDMPAAVLLRHMDYFQAHEAFCKQQCVSTVMLTQKRTKSPQLHAWLTKQEMRRECRGMRLQDLLLTPMQRLTRYPLLLRMVLKYTPRDAARLKYTQEACRVLEQYLLHTNEEARLSQSDIKVEHVLAAFKDSKQVQDWLLKSNMTLVGDRDARISVNRQRKQKMAALLFDEILMIVRSSRPVSLMKSSAHAGLRRGGSVSFHDDASRLKLVALIPLANTVVSMSASGDCIEVSDAVENTLLQIQLDTVEETHEWYRLMSEQVRHCGRWRRRRGAITDTTGHKLLAAKAQTKFGEVELPSTKEDFMSLEAFDEKTTHFLEHTPARIRAVRNGRRNFVSTPEVATPFRRLPRRPLQAINKAERAESVSSSSSSCVAMQRIKQLSSDGFDFSSPCPSQEAAPMELHQTIKIESGFYQTLV